MHLNTNVFRKFALAAVALVALAIGFTSPLTQSQQPAST